MLSHVQLTETPWTVAHQCPLSMGFSRQEYWTGLPCPPPGDLPDPGIEPASLMSPALAGGFFTTSAIWEPPGFHTFIHKWTSGTPFVCLLRKYDVVCKFTLQIPPQFTGVATVLIGRQGTDPLLCEFLRISGFPRGLVVMNLPANTGDIGSIPGSGRSPGGGTSNPCQYSCLGSPMGRVPGGRWSGP